MYGTYRPAVVLQERDYIKAWSGSPHIYEGDDTCIPGLKLVCMSFIIIQLGNSCSI
uniref:Uncharacterized protein n=1 Tax=Arion vulgaris TaxID=1028688 RepID=A0A0B6YM08_9EUPU